MSEYSRTRMTKNDGQSRQGPTHPESGDGYDTPSRYSQQQTSPSNLQPPEDAFDIPMQHIMPLISTMKEENEHLKNERGLMQADMGMLQQLSQGLLQENQKLRKHYNNRTVDIRRLIETITLNTNEDMNDISHQTHLLKEANISIVKTIEQQVTVLNDTSKEINQQMQQLQSFTEQAQHLEQLHRDLQISNKQLFYKCEQLKTQNSRTDYSSSEEYINQLICEVTALKNTNRSNIIKAKTIKNQHQRERPDVEEKHANVAKHIRELETEVKAMREQSRHTENKLEDAKESYQKHCGRLAATLKEYESSKNRLVEQDQEAAKIKRMTVEGNNRVKIATQQLAKIKKEKEKRQEEILLKKTNLKKMENEQKKQVESQQFAHKEQLKKYQNELANQSNRANEEIMGKLNPESTMLQESIDENREEYAVLVQELEELREGLKRLDNPVKEIIRLEYQLKKVRALKH